MAIEETGRPAAGGPGAERARRLAERAHRGQVEASGRPYIEHVRRVAEAVPPSARAVAWLHDALEWTGLGEGDLAEAGLSSDELAAVRLLTREVDHAGDSGYLGHVRAIAGASGRAGDIARIVKAADMEDRLRHPRDPGAAWTPPYAEAAAILAEAPGRGDRRGAARPR